MAIVSQQRAYQKAHPPIAIYRVATEGSQTRKGGVIQQGTSPLELTPANGQPVRAAQKGDHVVYADGSTAQIIIAAGEANGHVALVGSCLSNGDEIINTCQDVMLLIARKGVPMAEDLGHRHLNDMLQALQNGRYVHICGAAWRRQGMFGACVLVNKISGMVTWPRAYIQLGDVGPVDIDNFPAHLK